ncbi:hypothetical protein [Lentzea roselyniae]|uniref:hypothetical protein n=1 Tax=Lentzea roselyniae TaxID=531940 RepID=UPI0031F918F6
MAVGAQPRTRQPVHDVVETVVQRAETSQQARARAADDRVDGQRGDVPAPQRDLPVSGERTSGQDGPDRRWPRRAEPPACGLFPAEQFVENGDQVEVHRGGFADRQQAPQQSSLLPASAGNGERPGRTVLGEQVERSPGQLRPPVRWAGGASGWKVRSSSTASR